MRRREILEWELIMPTLKKYKVTLSQTEEYDINVEAHDEFDAERQVQHMWEEGEINNPTRITITIHKTYEEADV